MDDSDMDGNDRGYNELGYSERIRQRREALGLTMEAVAGALGMNEAWYRDLEGCDVELPMTLRLPQVSRLCALLRMEPFELLEEEPPLRHVSAAELRERVLADCRLRGWSPDEFGEHIGWDVTGLADDPEAYVSQMNLDGLHDLCSHFGLNRTEAIPEPVAV